MPRHFRGDGRMPFLTHCPAISVKRHRPYPRPLQTEAWRTRLRRAKRARHGYPAAVAPAGVLLTSAALVRAAGRQASVRGEARRNARVHGRRRMRVPRVVVRVRGRWGGVRGWRARVREQRAKKEMLHDR